MEKLRWQEDWVEELCFRATQVTLKRLKFQPDKQVWLQLAAVISTSANRKLDWTQVQNKMTKLKEKKRWSSPCRKILHSALMEALEELRYTSREEGGQIKKKNSWNAKDEAILIFSKLKLFCERGSSNTSEEEDTDEVLYDLFFSYGGNPKRKPQALGRRLKTLRTKSTWSRELINELERLVEADLLLCLHQEKEIITGK